MRNRTCINIVLRSFAAGLFLAPIVTFADSASVTFIEDVRPIFETSCVKCHGDNEVNADFQLHRKDLFLTGSRSGPVAVAGDAAHSLLIEVVSLPANDEHVMPHKGSHLTPEQIETLTKWINSGMHWPDNLTLRDRSPADAASQASTGNARIRYNLNRHLPSASPATVDQLLAEDNRARTNLVSAVPIDDNAWFRKLSVDLIGRIPTEDESRDYLARPAQQRRRDTIDALLKNPRWADRWTAFYADMLQARSGASGGKELMAYIHRCLETRKPYDEMARDLIAASGAPSVAPAVGFILGHNADPMVLAGATSQSFLGVRLACAECHDHPFDKWSQKEFYEFAGWFGKTQRNDHGKGGDGYIAETEKMSVRWPPEGKAADSARHPIQPDFLFDLETFTNPPSFLARFEAKRREIYEKQEKENAKKEFDGQLDNLLTTKLSTPAVLPGMNSDLESKAREDAMHWLQPGVVRAALAERLTSPRNRYFARAFVNRVWAELLGHGFYTPIDDFRDDTVVSHPRALEYMADEFIASGFDLTSLIRLIVSTDVYQRGHLTAGTAETVRQQSVAAFTAAPWRRMPAEALYDSLVVAGHLFDYKWPSGANIKEVEERVTYNVKMEMTSSNSMNSTEAPAMANRPKKSVSAYDLEDGAAVSFDSRSKPPADDGKLNNMMQVMRQDVDLNLNAMNYKKDDSPRSREMSKIVTKTIDDNPKFSSAFRIESPAPNAHFLRIFGQPDRERLGEFRDQTPSLRQELMMLNGRLSHEASRVGPSESLYYLLASNTPQPEKAVRQAYLAALTREPSDAELAEALGVLHEAPTLVEGMADLRWVLLNCDEFRYLP